MFNLRVSVQIIKHKMTHKLYDVLGVPRGCSKDDLKKAFKRLAVQMHPDKGGDPEKFKELGNAYEVLSDDEKRERYDQLGDEGYDNNGGVGGMHGMDAHSIFEQFFGNMPFGFHHMDPGHHHPGHQKKSNHMHEMKISLEDAYKGLQKSVKVTLTKICMQCKEQCFACQGKGHVMNMQRMGFLTQMTQRPCATCQTTGFIAKGKQGCKECNGTGSSKEEHKIELNIPAGVRNGHHIVFSGLGEQAIKENDIPGDLVFEIHVAQDANFKRQDNDLVYVVPISLTEAITGKEFTVPHFGGAFDVNSADFGIVQADKVYMVKGKGMPGGNLAIIFDVKYPSKKLSLTERMELRKHLEKSLRI
jgi:DnaJ-class molecular chaperone